MHPYVLFRLGRNDKEELVMGFVTVKSAVNPGQAAAALGFEIADGQEGRRDFYRLKDKGGANNLWLAKVPIVTGNVLATCRASLKYGFVVDQSSAVSDSGTT